jgi:ribokinase
MTPKITIVGSLNMDLVIRSARIPRPGETILGGEFHAIPGGKGANQAVAAARLGAKVSMIGRVGRDAFARPLLDNLAASGIDCQHVTQAADAATGVALIVVDDAGQNTIVVASGANMRLSPEDVEAAEDAIAASDALLLQLESPLETATHAACLARAHGVTVILNPAPARPLPEALLARVDVLIPNESETALLTGLPVGGAAELERAALALRRSGVPMVVLTLGASGALLASQAGLEHLPAYRVDPLDTTAAGDAFVAGFACALAEGKTALEAVRYGNAAGALATTKLGAQTSLPARQEVDLMILEGVLKGV